MERPKVYWEDVMWGSTADPLLGIRTLHENYRQGIVEIDDLMTFVRERQAAEEAYANRMLEISRIRPKLSTNEPGSSLLSQAFGGLKHETSKMANSHREVAIHLAHILKDLQTFLDDHRNVSLFKKEAVMALAKKYERCRADMEAARKECDSRWQLAQELKVKHQQAVSDELAAAALLANGEPDDCIEIVNFGDRDFTPEDFDDFITDLHRNVPVEDMTFMLGTYRHCFTGAALTAHLMASRHAANEKSATMLCADLLLNNFIRPVGKTVASGKFSLTTAYQWRRSAAITNEPSFRRARREAEGFELEFMKTVRAAESVRTQLEAACVDCMQAVQEAQILRLTVAKRAIHALITNERSHVPPTLTACDRLSVFLETLDPEHEAAVMAERERTGNARFPPVAPELSAARDAAGVPIRQTFGMAIDEDPSVGDGGSPVILEKLLDALYRARTKSAADPAAAATAEMNAWLEPNMHLSSVQALRMDLMYGRTIPAETLQQQPPTVLIGLLKLWLVQLPVSLCSHDIYEPLKMLYLSKSDELAAMRFQSLRNLLKTLSVGHYFALESLMAHLHKLIEPLDKEDTRINELSQLVGPLVLRPEVENHLTAHDRHPSRLLRDMITSQPEVFTVPRTAIGPNGSPSPLLKALPGGSGKLTVVPAPRTSSYSANAVNGAEGRSSTSSRGSSVGIAASNTPPRSRSPENYHVARDNGGARRPSATAVSSPATSSSSLSSTWFGMRGTANPSHLSEEPVSARTFETGGGMAGHLTPPADDTAEVERDVLTGLKTGVFVVGDLDDIDLLGDRSPVSGPEVDLRAGGGYVSMNDMGALDAEVDKIIAAGRVLR